MTIRVATYARVPAGLSRPAQRLARQQAHLDAAVRSWPDTIHAAEYADAGPTPPWGWPGLAALLSDAFARRFDLIVVERLDRLCAEPRQLRQILDHLAWSGVAVHPLAGPARRRLLAAGTAAAIVKLAELLG